MRDLFKVFFKRQWTWDNLITPLCSITEKNGGIHLPRLPPSLINVIKRLTEKAIISALKAWQNTRAVIQDLSVAQTAIDWAVTENLFMAREAILNRNVDINPL